MLGLSFKSDGSLRLTAATFEGSLSFIAITAVALSCTQSIEILSSLA